MCSLIGSVLVRTCKSFLLDGLKKLEYRGYDSAGCAFSSTSDYCIRYAKVVGGVRELSAVLDNQHIDGTVGIGHLRWATHGAISEKNAHPQFDCSQRIAVVHNGIIENYYDLSVELKEQQHAFSSATDTEVIAHLLEDYIVQYPKLEHALFELVNKLEGAYTFLALMQKFPDTLIAVCRRAPLCIGIADKEICVSSDPIAFAGKTNQVLFMPDKSFAIIRLGSVELFDFNDNKLPLTVQTVDVVANDAEKTSHTHYMLKEIYEQKKAIDLTVNFYRSISETVWKHLGMSAAQIITIDSITLVACGSSWHAALIGQFFFEMVVGIPTRAVLSSEFRHTTFFPSNKNLYLFISQSGETASTLEALRLINSFQLPTVVLTNTASSTMVREAHGFLLTQAGNEIAVASTKSFTTQLVALYWLAHRIARERSLITRLQLEAAEKELLVAGQVLEGVIETHKADIINKIAPRYAAFKQFIFLGRHINYPLAQEAALKMKGVSYLFAQCYPAGELKHGPIALIDDQTPVILFSHLDPLIYQKLLSNAQEVKARNGHLVAFVFEGQHELANLADTAVVIPRVNPLLAPLAMAGIMQFFIYHIACVRGCPIDHPRHLAKNMTVE